MWGKYRDADVLIVTDCFQTIRCQKGVGFYDNKPQCKVGIILWNAEWTGWREKDIGKHRQISVGDRGSNLGAVLRSIERVTNKSIIKMYCNTRGSNPETQHW